MRKQDITMDDFYNIDNNQRVIVINTEDVSDETMAIVNDSGFTSCVIEDNSYSSFKGHGVPSGGVIFGYCDEKAAATLDIEIIFGMYLRCVVQKTVKITKSFDISGETNGVKSFCKNLIDVIGGYYKDKTFAEYFFNMGTLYEYDEIRFYCRAKGDAKEETPVYFATFGTVDYSIIPSGIK